MNLSSHLNPERNTVLIASSDETKSDGQSVPGAGSLFVFESIHEMEGRDSQMCCFAPDGKHVVVVGSTDRATSEGFILLLSQEGIMWERSFSLLQNEDVTRIRFNNDGKIFAVVTDRARCLFINFADDQTAFAFQCDSHVEAIAFSRSGDKIALGTAESTIIVIDSSFMSLPSTMVNDDDRYTIGRCLSSPDIESLDFCNDDDHVLSAHSDGTVDFRRVDPELSLVSTTATVPGKTYFVKYVHYDEEADVLFGFRREMQRVDDQITSGAAFLVDPHSGKILSELRLTPEFFPFTSDLHHQCVGGDILLFPKAEVVSIWSIQSHKMLQKIRFDQREHVFSCISGDGTAICLLTNDGVVTILHRLPDDRYCKTLFKMCEGLISTSLSLDGSRVLVADLWGPVSILATCGRREENADGRRKKKRKHKK